MDDFEQLDICLVDFATGTPLVGFDTTKTIPKNSSRQRRCAIQAEPNQRFAFDIHIKPGFDWANCNGLEVKIGLDVGEQVNCRSVYLLKNRNRVNDVNLPHLVLRNSDGSYYYRIDSLLINHPAINAGAISKAQFYFRHLRNDSSIFAPPGLPRTINNQGKIRVEVVRTMISSRDQDRGLETNSIPTYRRMQKAKLLQKGITMEALLHVDPLAAAIEYKGNFRSDRPRGRYQQANFDFMYREAGYHDACVAKDDIIEIADGTRSQPTSPVTSRATISSNTATTCLSTTKPKLTLLMSAHQDPSKFSSSQDDLSNSPMHPNTNTDLDTAQVSMRVPGSQSGLVLYDFARAIDDTQTVDGDEGTTYTCTRSNTPLQYDSASRNSTISMTTCAGYEHCDPDRERISSLLDVCQKHQAAEVEELRILDLKLANVQQSRNACKQHRDDLCEQLREAESKCTALEHVSQDLEAQRHKMLQSIEESKTRTREALEGFCKTMKDIEYRQIESASARKRKRSEG